MAEETKTARSRREALLLRLRTESERAEHELLEAEHPTLSSLERWRSLVDAEDRLQRPVRGSAITPGIAVVFGTIALVALLQWLRCSQVEFTARLVASAIDIEAAGEGDLELPRRPSSITVSGFESLRVPDAQGAPTSVASDQGGPLELRLLPDPAAKVTLKPIHAADRNTVGMTFVAPRSVAFRVGGPSMDFQASLLHKVELRFLDARTENDYSEAAAVLGRSSSDFGIDVTADSWRQCVICTPLRIRTATFVEARRDDGLAPIKELSSIRSGRLYFTAIGVEHELRRGEALRLHFPKDAVTEVVSLSVRGDDETFELELRGSTNLVEVGSTTNPIDLRPTWLEWLRSRHGPALVWATCVWIFAALALIRKWSRREVD